MWRPCLNCAVISGLCALTCLFPLAYARADVFEPLRGARSYAMGGAHRGLGSSNEALWLNPAGMALVRRYSIEVQYDYTGSDHLQRANASVVDSKSGPIAAGISYTRDWGNPSGFDAALNRSHAGSALAIGEIFGAGLSVHNVTGAYTSAGCRQKISQWSLTAGAAFGFHELLRLGAVYHNMVHSQDGQLLPPSLGFGIGSHLRLLTLAADMELDMRDTSKHRITYRAGMELLLLDVLALRAGWHLPSADMLVDNAPQHLLSVGIGLINQSFGFNFAMERSLRPRSRLSMLGSFQAFL